MKPPLKLTLIYVLAILPSLLTAWAILKYGTDIPMGDQWDTPGGFLYRYVEGKAQFHELYVQHNESH